MTDQQYRSIEKYAFEMMNKSLDPQHTWEHVTRVRANALKMVKKLKLDKQIDMNLLQACCLLHDVTYTKYKVSPYTLIWEGQIAQKILLRSLVNYKLDKSDIELIGKTVKNHPHSFPFGKLNPRGNIYDKILQDADSMDLFTKEREITFNKAGKNKLFYRIAGIMSRPLFNFGRKHISIYLNYPEILKKW